jgi:hypothetical protein
MPARIRKIRHDEETRNKIKAAYLINRLTKFVAGEVKLESAQVTAALGLLRKVVPDMQSVEHSGEVQKTYVVRMPARPESMEEWQKRYAPPEQKTIQ